jgi:hypothetical protein
MKSRLQALLITVWAITTSVVKFEKFPGAKLRRYKFHYYEDGETQEYVCELNGKFGFLQLNARWKIHGSEIHHPMDTAEGHLIKHFLDLEYVTWTSYTEYYGSVSPGRFVVLARFRVMDSIETRIHLSAEIRQDGKVCAKNTAIWVLPRHAA